MVAVWTPLAFTNIEDDSLPPYIDKDFFNLLQASLVDTQTELNTTSAGPWKTKVRAATTANITLSGTQTVDTVTLVAGDRVLVKNQTTASQNGLYVVATGAWARAVDANTSAKLQGGLEVRISQGSQAKQLWYLTNTGTITLDTTALVFERMSAAQIAYGGSTNLSSTDVEAALDELDTEKLALAGGTMLGALLLAADPSVALGAATKQYADLKLPLAGGTLTNFLTLHADPASALHAVTKQYADAIASGLDIKQSVRAATTANITLSGTQTVDTVALIAGDRVLVKDQASGSANGIYTVSAGAWARATDADSSAEINAGMFVYVEEGSPAQADSGWVLSTNNPITLGTTALVFTQFSQAGVILAGTGLTKTGNTLAVDNSVVEVVSRKDAVNGYAGLNASGIVPIAHLASGTPTGAKFVRDDNSLQTVVASLPDASASVRGPTFLDRDPQTSTSPIAIGQNSLFLETFIQGLALVWGSPGTNGNNLTATPGAAWIQSLNKVYNVASTITGPSMSFSASTFYYVYLYDNSGTPALDISTTAPASPYKGSARSKTGDTSRRLIGVVRTDASGTPKMWNFLHHGWGLIRYLEDINSASFRVLSAGTATTFTTVSASPLVPSIYRTAQLRFLSAAASIFVDFTNSDLNPGVLNRVGTGNEIVTPFYLNSSQALQYKNSAAAGDTYVDVLGYYLER